MNFKIIVFPGAFQYVKNYGNYDGLDIWLKNFQQKEISKPDCIVAHSAGVNFSLTLKNPENCKFIFINPLIKKRNILSVLLSWIKFLFVEGVKMEKIAPINNWPYDFKLIFKLLKVDVFDFIKKIPKDKITIIRGKKDDFFCDKKASEIIKKEGINLIEVDAGHDWNQNIEEAVTKLLGD
jgi:hypothetical protein